jgi:hypothetical protein
MMKEKSVKKRIIEPQLLIPLIIAASVMLIIAISNKAFPVSLKPDELGEWGNTMENIRRGGFAAIQDDWIFYVNLTENNRLMGNYRFSLYKMRTDGTEKTVLDEGLWGYNTYINVIGDWIYYYVFGIYPNSGQLYRIRTDGTEKTTVADSMWGNKFIVIGDWIYFDRGIYKYRIRTDGTDLMLLRETLGWDFYIEGDWIYFDDSRGRYWGYQRTTSKILLNGTGIRRHVYAGNVRDMIPPLDSEYAEILRDTDLSINEINIAGDWIFFTGTGSGDWRGGYNLYKVRTDGTEFQLIE